MTDDDRLIDLQGVEQANEVANCVKWSESDGSAGAEEPPQPRMSGAIARKPAAATARICLRQV